MVHKKRRYCVGDLTIEKVHNWLTKYVTMACCTGFKVGDTFWLNDAFSEDGAQEYAIVKQQPDGAWVQLESLTISWMKPEDVMARLQQCVDGVPFGIAPWPIEPPRIETFEEHRQLGCRLCA